MNKSVLHDATPSWNGFNYQGKIGIYVCLKMIFKKMMEYSLESNKLDDFLTSYAIQYEWIEDFSILKNDQYISHHQVKHKADTDFSTHIEALVTILNRTQKILPTSDLVKYLHLNSHDDKEALLEEILDDLKNLKVLNQNGTLNDSWRDSWHLLNNIKKNDIYTCLDEFEQLSSRAFKGQSVYFHTSNIVSQPQKDISTYKGIPVHLKSELKDKLTLKDLADLNIFIGDKQTSPFELVLSDVQLETKLKELIDDLLSKIHDQSTYRYFTDNDREIYRSALLRELDSHISKRHLFIHQDKVEKSIFLEERPKITFNSFMNILKKVFKDQDDEYWELYCQQGFELAYSEKWDEFDQIKNNDPKYKSLYETYQKNLENFKIHYLSKFYSKNYSGLLKKLSPQHFSKEYSLSDFYRKISESVSIKDVFLDFIKELDILNDEDNLSYSSSHNKSYFPSAVDLEHRDKTLQENRITIFRKKMAKLPYEPTYFLANADYFITNTRNPEDINDLNFDLDTISELKDIDLNKLPSRQGYPSSRKINNISNIKKLKFRHYETAIKELNNE